MSAISVTGIQEQASKLCESACQFILGIQEHPFGGGECVILLIEDLDQKKICLRVQRTSLKYASDSIQREVKYRQGIARYHVPYF